MRAHMEVESAEPAHAVVIFSHWDTGTGPHVLVVDSCQAGVDQCMPSAGNGIDMPRSPWSHVRPWLLIFSEASEASEPSMHHKRTPRPR
ncbi:hypothetical protein AcW2_004033 [Taiwanofungus camphoratus]|nr:hypothetical protein AcW2_004033 [Antrodia cinnamomea]